MGDFYFMGENLGELTRVVVSDTHVSHHTKGGDVKRLDKDAIKLDIMLDQYHRQGIPVRFTDE